MINPDTSPLAVYRYNNVDTAKNKADLLCSLEDDFYITVDVMPDYTAYNIKDRSLGDQVVYIVIGNK